MIKYTTDEYLESKKWIAKRIQEGFTWDDLKHLCVSEELFEDEFCRLQEEEMIIPPDMEIDEWTDFVQNQEENHPTIVEMYGISSAEKENHFPVPTGDSSSWNKYKNHLLGKTDGKPKMSEESVDQIEQNCHWLLNRLTNQGGPVKGLVMGSVQSGKTANMIGLVSMAADHGWNFFIILSGSIENLRKQTRDRFISDLKVSQGVNWRVLDYSSDPKKMIDVKNGELYMESDLKLNNINNSFWGFRYVTVCLKNSTRLERLINWLHSDPLRAARLRILVIDDEADQAGINTAKMSEYLTEEDIIERTVINQLLVNLANGKNADGSQTDAPFQSMNYFSFTATPYANVLNEAFEESLYPKDFICTLPESKDYFGLKVIFGSTSDENYPGINVIRTISISEMNELNSLHKGDAFTLPEGFKKSICWFLCSSAILRLRGHKKPISMLIHTTPRQKNHFEEYEVLKKWLLRERDTTGSILSCCKSVYEEETKAFTIDDLKLGFPDYGRIDKVISTYPDFATIKPEIELLLSHIENIAMAEDKSCEFHKDAIHLCVDNSSANRMANDGTYLRVLYPTAEQLEKMEKAPVFIVIGGNTLARGLTLEGLVCTYFARNTNQADTLMQMGRWFGYRTGFELIQRIWMPEALQEKFELLERIDEKLKIELKDYMDKGKSPIQFGPRIVNSAVIKRFMITAKNRMQSAEECDFDFSGDSYETTAFDNNEQILQNNISVTERFLTSLSIAEPSSVTNSAFVWTGIDYQKIEKEFFDKFKLCKFVSFDLPVFVNWMREMNKENRYLHWNIAIAGDKHSETKWSINGCTVGTIERSKKSAKTDYIDIGSLRSGRDAICDVIPDKLSLEQSQLFNSTRKSGRNIVSARSKLGMEDIPLLLIYRIDKNKGKSSSLRESINTPVDIIGFSIIVPGDETDNGNHAKTLTIRIPESL